MTELASQPVPILSLYEWYSQDKLFVNRRYQRKLVWTLREKQKLIESILRKYPVPGILLAEREDEKGTFEIIDGLQRLQAIVSFIETGFSTIDDKLFDIKHFTLANNRAKGKQFLAQRSSNMLSQGEVSNILNYLFGVSIMRNTTEEEINEVFGRINTYGHQLSDQERRQAGVENKFSETVRKIACTLRGDTSEDILLLKSMPGISIDMPMTRHGYEVKAESVFWVQQGILRSTDLRDSMDEQCIADITASIVGGQIIERSKDALDEIYRIGSADSIQIENALETYGADDISKEFKYCVEEIIKVCNHDKPEKLRNIIFYKKTTNAFPAIFAVILIAFHELFVKDEMTISDYGGVKKAITNLTKDRINTSRQSTSPAERIENIAVIKSLISPNFIKKSPKEFIYGNHDHEELKEILKRSQVELANYELKQGILRLDEKRKIDDGVIKTVIETICAIANNGPNVPGKIIIGVSNKSADTKRIKQLDGISPIKVGKRDVVGILREATALGISAEAYVAKWRDAIKHSGLSDGLKNAVLAHIDFNDFNGLGVLVITVPPQKSPSFLNGKVYARNLDETVVVEAPSDISQVAMRFAAP
ncbi:GmrSD restriction endonuclease domain-containing protein [Burkholderia ubonensis]|uniref:GmrSD restriction endonuclease domain-containing protein n=1 Tax=Burkholderia ubonensis TaxID=101571 RepID=UPI0009B3F27D|nr:DUF262 domain-containing protein [Burkholderia ubonensis]